jgi:putative ABC transport system permease protein
MLRLGGIGALVAVPCAVLLARTLSSQLFGVSAADPNHAGRRGDGDGARWAGRGIGAARRAASVQPMEAVRAE